MTFSLHTAVIGTYEQLLPPVTALIDKAEQYCKENGLEASALTEAKLADDMWPYAKQIEQILHHSGNAIEGLRKGTFSPLPGKVANDFDSLRKFVEKAQEIVASVTEDELETLAAGEVLFVAGSNELRFDVQVFLMSFTLPNFYFHVTTAYDILRNQGLPIGKLDFVGGLKPKS